MNFFISLFLLLISCSTSSVNETKNIEIQTGDSVAKIVSVKTSGNENNYSFSVGVLSSETGCNQYADWWEVVSVEGKLIYRRILAHSHIDEQPFVRSGGNVDITKDQLVIVRVHMNNSGFSTLGFRGSVSSGFSEFKTEESFASELATQAPLPTGCAF